MSKRLSRFKKERKRKFKVPRSVQHLIPIDEIWEDGTFKTGVFYSKCYRFADINFKVASDDHKREMLNHYAALLGVLDCDSHVQISAFHHRPTKWDTLSSAGIPLVGDTNDLYRKECNLLISGRSSKRTSYVEDKYITISSKIRNPEDVEEYFKRVEADVSKAFERLGSAIVAMNAEERLLLLKNFYRPEESNFFNFNVQERKKRREDFRSYIAPDGIRRHWNYLQVGSRFVRVLFLKDIANYVDDDFIDTIYDDGQHYLVLKDRTKTKSSCRTLPLVAPFEELLLRIKAEQEQNRRLCGNCYCKDYLDYIYVNELGELMKPDYLTSKLPKLLEEHNMRRIRFHDLRHSCASLLLANGVSLKDIQSWLGHSTISTTANIYVHQEFASKINSANAILQILPASNKEG